MYYDALKTFTTLAEVKNFTKTAEILHISQPSVSLHIKNLEKEFNTELFIRSPKFLKITETGEILYERAKQILSMYEQAQIDISEHHDEMKGKLIIGASFTIGEYILPSLVVELHTKYPDLELEVFIGNTEEIVQSVRLLEVDIGLVEGPTYDKNLLVEPFMEDELFIVGSKQHKLAKKQSVALNDLQNQLWFMREEGSGTREYLKHVIRSNGLKIKSIITISSNQGIKEMIMSSNIGLSLLSTHVIERDIQEENLFILPLNHVSFKRLFFCVRSNIIEDKKSVSAFKKILQQKRNIVD
ncbi:LysR family transcriptional regulator [Psychrobacillus vulpis]|uniref:LysR family transcriptional regulator n=1 Tax=Psychrobacillus vulpis TaxID=2325572 RepID=A0A544TRM9_9BACI|nr:LysR family transcriptional regulator [Psychrobacillus vulpis]TQR20092.1 LysR family transcriptional regulator [Psychrobacillus vulpis]